MANYRQHDAGYNKRMVVGFAAIVLIHLGIIWGLATGLAQRAFHAVTEDVKVNIIDEKKADDKPPPPPKLDLPPPPQIQVPPPIIQISIPVEAPAITVTDKPVPPTPRPVAMVPSKPAQFKKVPNPQDYYPDQSKRLEEEGSVIMSVCVNADGKYDGQPTVTTSSGFARLDGAGVRMVMENGMTPGTLDGKPIHSCKPLKVTFKLVK